MIWYGLYGFLVKYHIFNIVANTSQVHLLLRHLFPLQFQNIRCSRGSNPIQLRVVDALTWPCQLTTVFDVYALKLLGISADSMPVLRLPVVVVVLGVAVLIRRLVVIVIEVVHIAISGLS